MNAQVLKLIIAVLPHIKYKNMKKKIIMNSMMACKGRKKDNSQTCPQQPVNGQRKMTFESRQWLSRGDS